MRDARDVGDLLGHHLGLGGVEVDLVDDRHDGEARLDRLVEVGEGLGLDPLRGVDDEDRALARGERPRDLISEVDVAGGVDEVELVALAVAGRVCHADRLELDRDPALPLEVHGVEDLVLHVALADRPGALEQPIGQRRLAVIDVGDDAEIPH